MEVVAVVSVVEIEMVVEVVEVVVAANNVKEIGFALIAVIRTLHGEMNVIVVKHRKMMMVVQVEAVAVVVVAVEVVVEDFGIEMEDEEAVVVVAAEVVMEDEVVQCAVTVTVIVVVAKDLIKCHHNLDLITKINSPLCPPHTKYRKKTQKCPFSINEKKSNEIDFRQLRFINLQTKNVY